MLLSSGDAYTGLTASFVALEAGAFENRESNAHRVAVHLGPPHRLWDRRDGAAWVGPHARGDVVITAAGETRSLKWDRASSLIALEVDPGLVGDIEVGGRFSHRDPYLEELAFSMYRELLAGLPSGALFGEELATRLFEPRARTAARGGLSRSALNRALSFMHEKMSERIRLADLASLADLSPFHFARQFRTSMGIAPHAYLVRVRVEEAARLILRGAPAADAAANVGFSSQGHLTQHMRRALGITPGRLARR